jgi:AcrR family transcriptional regulator
MPSTPRRPSRFELRRRKSRAALIEAAIELFQQQGVRATKLEEICERADVSPRTFFNHFETRTHLYRAIAQQRIEQTAARIEVAAAAQEPFGAKLAALLREVAAYLAARPAWREMVGEMLSLRHDGDGTALRTLREALVRLLAAGVARGEVSARHRPEVLADLLFGALTTALGRWSDEDGYDLERGLAETGRALLDLLSPRRIA